MTGGHPASRSSGAAIAETPAQRRAWVTMMRRAPRPDDYNRARTGQHASAHAASR